MAHNEFDVSGMSCGGCEENVESAVGDLDGVESVEADNVAGTVEVAGDADPAAVRDAIEEAGYTVSA